MTFAAADSISAGRPYPVLLVNDREPTDIQNFDGGGLTVTIDGGGLHQLLRGDGSRHGDHVRFHEKDASAGKDVRVWRIVATDGGSGFTACSGHGPS